MVNFIIAVIGVISVFAEHLFKQKKNKQTRITRETVNKGQIRLTLLI